MNIIGKRKIWYLFSGIMLLVGILSFVLGGLKLGMDFRGGSFLEVSGLEDIDKVKEVFNNAKIETFSLEKIERNKMRIKAQALDEDSHKKILDELKKINKDKEIKEENFETIGRTVSKDITKKAYLSIFFASFIIILYVAWTFRKVSKPVASWKYGVCAILALIHDVLFVIGIFSLLGKIFNIEIDSLFVTALLTILSFSVHDTIVIFDRIRENLRRSEKEDFEEIVNDSVVEMIARSINTSMVIIFVILSLYLLGGETMRYFVLALLLGMIIGTYSSIFIASPLLVTWKNWDDKRKVIKDS